VAFCEKDYFCQPTSTNIWIIYSFLFPYIGDDAKDRQYRSILSFDTNSIPDNATIASAQVKIKKQGVVGDDPFNTHGNLLLEIRSGTFSNSIVLNAEDFSAIANIGSTKDKFSGANANWYTATLSNINLGLVNKYGDTQFRLLFTKDDNDDMGADYVKFFSGNSISDQPQLVVTYLTTTIPNRPPVINGGSALSISIPENTTTVGGVTALDPDGQSITYSISGLDAGKFSLVPNTGILTFVTAPDFESIPLGTVYHLTAQASDGSLTSTQDISVTVTPVNEFAPVVTSNGGGAVINISLPENTIDVTTITVTDADLPSSIEYIFAGGADDSLFTVDQTTGKLSFVTAPSYNAPNDAGLDHVYNIHFEINDGELGTHLDLVISIINPNTVTGELLDPTFGSSGVVTTKYNGLPSSAREVVLQTDGKIITLVTIKLSAEQSQKIITRYNSNGTVDTSFGTNGSTLIEVESFSGSKIALQSDGKLIVGGLSIGNFAVIRYNSNGSLDTSFGTNGMGVLDIRGFNGYLTDMAIQADGKIVVVSDYTADQSNYTDFLIARFTSNGAPDSTFVANGFNIIDNNFPNNRYNYGEAVVIQPDSKIVMSGNMMDNDGKANLSLARLNSNGSLDTTAFGTNGKGTVSTLIPPDFQTSSSALALQADGRIVVAGTTNQNLTLVRYNTNGTLDTSFGGTGIVHIDFGNVEQADDLVIQADGKIIVVGNTSSLGFLSDFLLVRYNSNGSLDTTFGANGKTVTDFGNSADTALGIAQQPNGKVIVSGASGENAILVRYDTSTYTETQTSLSFKSAAAYDGWLLESGEKSNQGGTVDKTSTIINTGDDAKDRQYRGILSFNTISIPDEALITSAQVKIRRQGYVGTDAFQTHGDLLLDIRTGTFSNNLELKVEDFSAIANIGTAQDKFSGADANWYTATLSDINLGYINKYGVTQFRVLFSLDDNNDMGADYIKFFSGNATSADQPQLVVTYSTNSSGTNTTTNPPPVITSNGGGTAANITVPENTTAVTTVTASDAEGQPITYSILSGSDADKFSINAGTGILTFVTAPDFEAIPGGTIYHMIVQASDGNLTDVQDIAVTVTGINEFAPVITSNGGGAAANISLPENTVAVTTITATDADLPPQTLAYSIVGGADAARFSMLDPSEGKLSFVTAPSYNAPNDAGLDHVYYVVVQASDGALTDTQEIIISILNPNVAGITVLHHFGTQSNNGRIPYDLLTMSNGFFYGTTTYWGAPYNVPPTNPANKGNVFRMNMDGTGFTVLHEFTGGAADGWKPWSGLAISGDMIFGSTVYGGPRGEGGGVIYEMNINGSGFRVLHAFGEPGDGFGGSTSPILVGDTLYGITRWGGNGTGTIYSYNTTTEVYTQLHRFAVNSSDGNSPLGTLTAANDGYLYGLTWLGGMNNMGTLFRIKPDGSAFETLYHFAGGTQGKYPYDTLAFDGKRTLYGTTLGEYGNNSSDLGLIFKYDMTSKTYSVLHTFAGGANDGGKPNGSVILSSDGLTLYGSTHGDDAWGGNEFGILYQMNIDGTGFKQLYEFSGGLAGATPMRTPLLINGMLYGMTAYGGAENYGIVYRYPIPNATALQTGLAAFNINLFTPAMPSNAEISVSENNIAVTKLAATDADIPAQPLDYSLTGGADSALFSINSSTGELVFIAAPDYEIPADAGADNKYNITVQASDGTLAATQDISVTVAPVSDNAPVITSTAALSNPENNMTVTTITATDADLPPQPLTYSITGGADSALISVNPSTGELAFITAPDYEIPKDAGVDNIYNVTVQVSDGTFATTQDIVVTVTAVNDNTPVITSPASFTVLENTIAVATVSATDADLPAQTLIYSITDGTDLASFTINSATGALAFIAAHDYEIPNDTGSDNIHNVTIQVSDGTQNITQNIVVSVIPVNDNNPAITSLSNFSILENTNMIATITAADADRPAQVLTYSIIGGADAVKFSIVGTTGALTFITPPDFEIPKDFNVDNIYEVVIQVSDGGYNSTKSISVQVTNGVN